MSGAEGGIRTLTGLLPTDFKSVASAISPPRLQTCSQDSIDPGCVPRCDFRLLLTTHAACFAYPQITQTTPKEKSSHKKAQEAQEEEDIVQSINNERLFVTFVPFYG